LLIRPITSAPLKRVMNVQGREIPDNPECGESHHLEHAE